MVALQLIMDCHSFIIPNTKLFLVLRNGYDGESCALTGLLTEHRQVDYERTYVASERLDSNLPCDAFNLSSQGGTISYPGVCCLNASDPP